MGAYIGLLLGAGHLFQKTPTKNATIVGVSPGGPYRDGHGPRRPRRCVTLGANRII